MGKKIKLFCVICFTILCFALNEKNLKSKEYFDAYDAWEHAIKCLIKEFNAIKLIGSNEKEILVFSQKINDLVIVINAKSLLENISKTDFRFYYCNGRKTQNIIETIEDDFVNKKGFYNFLFDKKKYFADYYLEDPSFSLDDSGHTGRGKIYDVSRYLKEYKDKLKWYVFYLPKEDVYEAWFSIPNDLVAEFEYFHYRIKKIDGKLVIIGF